MQIIVLGMHRSGTSALCGLLNLAGVYFGVEEDFIPRNEENPKGFWERKDVRRLNDQILHGLGCDWSELSHLGQEKLSDEIQASFLTEAKSIIKKLQQKSPTGILGLKEPRLCLLMDYWSGVFDPDAFYILIHRDPEEIAVSLETRGDMPVEVANYLTEQYFGHAISSLQNKHFHIASFAKLVTDPCSELDAIMKSIEKATGVALNRPERKDIESFVSPSLYRSKSKGQTYSISHQLKGWSEELSAGSLPKLTSFHASASNSVLSYEHARRFSEFIKLNERFRRLEKDYFLLKQITADQKQESQQQYETDLAELKQAASQKEAIIIQLQALLTPTKAAEQDTKLKDRLLYRLNLIQSSATAQFSRPMYVLENKWPGTVRGILLIPRLFWWTLTFSLVSNLRLYRQENMLLATGMFDLSWYVQHNPDVVLGGDNSVQHWLKKGWKENRDPHPLFNTAWYLEQNPDVRDAGINPLTHYLSHGAFEGRDPHPLFSSEWYLSQYPDVVDTGINPLMHYLLHGAAEGRDPNPQFDSNWYLAQNPEVAQGELNPLVHYVIQGLAEGYSTLPSIKREPIRRLDTFDEELDRATRNDLRDFYAANDFLNDRAISIVMPTFNRAGVITAAIKSVIQQTHKNWELLIVDDGSDDETESVVSRFANDERIKYFKNDRGGVCHARNFGLDVARGDLVGFLDSDNTWDHEFLALLVAAIEKRNIEIAYCGLRMQQNGLNVGYRGDVFNYAECLSSNYVDLNSLLFKRSVIGNSRFDASIRRMNDWDFFLLVAVNRRVEYFPFVGVSYSFHERADQISELEPLVYKKLIQERHKNRQADGNLMTTRCAFARIQLDVAILLAAPREKCDEWGDHHFATGLAQALTQRGHRVVLYYFQENVEGASPDLTISLRGLTEHTFPFDTIKVIWSISHPDLLTWQQIDDCDLLFCASLTWPQMLHWAGKSNVFSLLQCTDHKRFFPQTDKSEPDSRVLFVGNSRKADRPIVRYAAESGVNLHIYGTNWEERVPETLVKGEYIPNEQLTSEYASASVVLNDHWPSMKDFGVISNRVFDVTASGGVLVSDHVPGIQRVFGDAVHTFQTEEEFPDVLKQAVVHPGVVDLTALGAWVDENHTFDTRVDEILSRVEEFALKERGGVLPSNDDKPVVAMLGTTRELRVGIVPQLSGTAMTSSAFIRLVQPLTSDLDELTINLKRADQLDNLRDLDAIVVSRTAFDNQTQAERFLEQSDKQGIPVVVDVDDAFHLMDESHPQFEEYQTKIDALNLVMDSAEEIWCSTTLLQDSLKSRFGETILFPNSIDPRLWRSYRDFADQPQRDDDHLDLLYAGSFTHGSDLEMLMPVLDQLEKTIPIRLTVVGIASGIAQRPWIRRLDPGVNSIYPRFAPWLRSHASLFDVGIAPLVDNTFNRFKSDLKVLEYRAMGLVTVASVCQPYVDSNIIDKQSLCLDPAAWKDSLYALASNRGKLEQLKRSVKLQSDYIWKERSAVSVGNRIARRLCDEII